MTLNKFTNRLKKMSTFIINVCWRYFFIFHAFINVYYYFFNIQHIYALKTSKCSSWVVQRRLNKSKMADGHHFWKPLNCHICATVRRILMKFGKTIQRTEPQAENKEKETKNGFCYSPWVSLEEERKFTAERICERGMLSRQCKSEWVIYRWCETMSET